MVTRIGHMGLRVRNLDQSVEFARDVLGLREVQRDRDRSYLTCNERHHELILIAAERAAYDHIGLEVDDARALERAPTILEAKGARVIGFADDEPGVERTLTFVGPGGHVFKLFHGMDTSQVPTADRLAPAKFEHVSLKVRNLGQMERFLKEALGFEFSDRVAPVASWWHCDGDHHGIALQVAPVNQLHHYAWAFPDLSAMGVVADRLAARDRTLIWGPGRHGPGNNHFTYFFDADGFVVENCSELASVGADSTYVPRTWPLRPRTLSQWGGLLPLSFAKAGKSPATPAG